MISKLGYSAHPSVADKTDVEQFVIYCKEKLIRGESVFLQRAESPEIQSMERA